MENPHFGSLVRAPGSAIVQLIAAVFMDHIYRARW